MKFNVRMTVGGHISSLVPFPTPITSSLSLRA